MKVVLRFLKNEVILVSILWITINFIMYFSNMLNKLLIVINGTVSFLIINAVVLFIKYKWRKHE